MPLVARWYREGELNFGEIYPGYEDAPRLPRQFRLVNGARRRKRQAQSTRGGNATRLITDKTLVPARPRLGGWGIALISH